MAHHVILGDERQQVVNLWRYAIQTIARERVAREALERYEAQWAAYGGGPEQYAEQRRKLQEALDHAGILTTGALLDLDSSVVDRACKAAHKRLRAESDNPSETGNLK